MTVDTMELPRLTDEDRQKAINRLSLLLSHEDLRKLCNSMLDQGRGKGVEWIVAETETESRAIRLRPEELAEFLVDVFGIDILRNYQVRCALLRNASREQLDLLDSYESVERGYEGHASRIAALAKRKWHAGRGWAWLFATTLGFPAAFAGMAGEPPEDAEFEVYPYKPLPPLQDFQQELVRGVIDTLNSEPGENRAILNLPTGAGKTRTAVESLISWRLNNSAGRGILWIAQSDELCEQAVLAFKEVWLDQGHRKTTNQPLSMHRLWGGNHFEGKVADVTVSSIQKLDQMLDNEESPRAQEWLSELSKRIGAVVVDEAHRMESPSYRNVLDALGINLRLPDGKSNVPLIGLTATPFRANCKEASNLAGRFHRRILRPTCLGDRYMEVLRRRGVLSRPVHKLLKNFYAGEPDSDDVKYADYFKIWNEFSPELICKLGEDFQRNISILKTISSFPRGTSVLFFGCSVQHAEAMSVLLRRRDIPAAAVSAKTPTPIRRFLIEEFRAKRIHVLCNFQVLTTGFDAPKVDAVVLGRPTASPVLYEQMIGRGMRGPSFGGTETCTVVDVEDNLRFKDHLAFNQYEAYWEDYD